MELSDTGAVAEERWGAIHKVAFRFTFCYFLLYIFPLSGTLGWLWWSKPLVKYEGLWHKIVPWVGARVLHLTYAITIFPEVNGGSDTTYDYVKSFCFLVLAALATLVWTTIDRKRTAYPKLDHWLRWYVRLVLACALLVYGCGKVIPMQMPSPSLSTLMQPFGDLTPYRLSWTFIGASSGYETFAGMVEMLGGILLLVPGMATLGALVALGAMSNVFMLNMCYGIPVKFWALHLIIFSVFLILPDAQRLINFFVLNRKIEPEPPRPLFERRWLNQLWWGMQWAVGLYLIATTLYTASGARHQVANIPEKSPLYGVWTVEKFTADGELHPPLLTDNQRWQRMIFSSGQTLTIQEMNGKFSPYALSIDTQKSSLSLVRINPTLASSPWWSEWQSDITTYNAADPSVRSHEYAQLNYNRPEADAVTLEGLVNGHHLQVTLKKEQRSFLVKTLGFRWINDEYDFFNERVIE